MIVNEEHPLKQRIPTELIELGIFKIFSLEHPRKQLSEN
jgi:hypothetical protein